jgi:hypothetical protein
MTRIILAVAAAFALVSAAPAFACPDCKDCPMHKDKVAAAEKVEKKDADKKCACGKDPKECKCATGKCDCHAKHGETKDGKKS